MNTQLRNEKTHGNEFYAFKRFLIRLFGVLMAPTFVYGQTGGHIDYSPKTPEAAAFEQVAEIPVGNYTGTANISIPLYTIECGEIKVPISLDYLGTAIRVNQEASWVGLNWMLNAGGAITTQLSPSYDTSGSNPGEGKRAWRYLMNKASMITIYPNGGAYKYKIGYKIDGLHPDWCGGYGKNWFLMGNCTVLEDTVYYYNDLPQQVYNIALNHGDGESPRYHATFLGHTISFIWDRLKEEFFITGEAQGFKIEGHIGAGPTIIDGNGIKYEFSAIETGMPEGTNVNPYFSRFDYTYYLSKIITPSGHMVQFNYTPIGFIHPVYTVNEQIYDNNYPQVAITNYAKNNNPMIWKRIGTNGSNHIRTLSPYYTLNPLRLTSIVTDHQIVKFIRNSKKRLDIRGEDYSLQKIEVYKKTSSTSENLVKRFCFDYSYSARNTTGGNTVKELLGEAYYQWFGNDDFMYYRLMLNKIWEEGINDAGEVIKKPAYIFSYYPMQLPCKASAAVDYWGYYNGKENNIGTTHTLIPRGISADIYDGIYNFSDDYLRQIGANRLADENNMKACMLTSIQYPTGGITTFEYEPHDFSNYIYKRQEPSVIVNFKTINVYTANTSAYSRDSSQYKEKAEFNIDHEGIYKLTTSFYKSDINKKAYWNTLIGRPTFLWKKINGTNRDSLVQCLLITPADTTNVTSSIIKKDTLINLTAGKYKIIVSSYPADSYPSFFCQTDASLSYIPPKPRIVPSIGGGLRIKSITMADNGNRIKTFYDYKDEEGNTSGILMAPVIHARQKMVVYQQETVQNTGYNTISPHTAERRTYWTASGSNMAPPTSINVAYGRVTVTKTGNDHANGKSIFEYNNNRWNTSYTYDFMRRVENPLNGKLKLQIDYDSLENKVRQVTHTYNMNCVDSRLLNAVIENIYVGPSGPTGGTLVSNSDYADALGGGCMQIYLYPSVQFSLTSTSSQTTEYVGQQGIAHTVETTFNPNNHLEATIKESTSRTGERILTEIYYPTDFFNNNIATILRRKNIINVPMEMVSSHCKDSIQVVTTAKRTAYNSTGLPTAIYSLKDMEKPRTNYNTWTSINSLTGFEQVTSISYNSVGKPRGVTEYGHDQTIYIWGYGTEYPIAVIKGVTQDAVISKLGGQSAMNNLESALVPTMDAEALFSILSEIQGALVTTYEFKPLIGVTKTIMPNGMINTYEYDALGRLTKIHDHHGTVSQQFQYNYKRR